MKKSDLLTQLGKALDPNNNIMKTEKLKYSPVKIISPLYGYATNVYCGERSTVETDLAQVWGVTEKQCEERAKLFSQAPEMLETLKKVRLQIGMIEHNWDYNERVFMPEVIKLLKELE